MKEIRLPEDERALAVADNVKRIRESVAAAALRSGRKESDVRLMAVTKTVEAGYINVAIANGIDLIGENKVQEFLSKKDDLNLDGVEKHLIGHLQTNKVKKIVGLVDMIQSVDSVAVAEEISKRSVAGGIVTDALVEINIGAEESKTGADRSALEDMLLQIGEMPGIKVCGLMTIPPIEDDIKKTAKFFEEMYKLFVDISTQNRDNIDMKILSMGMSGDFETAIECGSTLVRVGSKMFGPRVYA